MTGNKFDCDPEAIAWARQRVEEALERLDDLTRQRIERGPEAEAKGMRFAAWQLRRSLLGDGQGCVIAAFDVRRPEMEAAFASLQERQEAAAPEAKRFLS